MPAINAINDDVTAILAFNDALISISSVLLTQIKRIIKKKKKHTLP